MRRLSFVLLVLLGCAGTAAAQSAGVAQPPFGSRTPVVASGSTTPRSLAARHAEVVNVLDFGGATQAALQAAINYAAAQGGGKVLLPRGVITVRPDTARIVLRSNVHLEGQGEASIVRVHPSTGNYGVLFGAAADGDALTNVTLRDFYVDQNTSAVTGNVALGSGAAQVAVQVYAGGNIRIERMRFDTAGVNTLNLNGASLDDVEVADSKFHFMPKGGAAAYDNSAVYLDCTNHRAHRNTFAAAVGSNARAGIETHGGPGSVVGNLSDGYWTLVNIVSNNSLVTDTRPGSDLLVSGNKASRANWGIQLWSVTGRQVSNVAIVGNVLSISHVTHGKSNAAGIAFVYDAGGTLAGTYRGVSIVGNVITHELEGAAGHAMADGHLTGGINVFPAGAVEDLTVAHNVIVRAPAAGIRLGNYLTPAPIRRARVTGNVLTDFGQNTALSGGFRAGFFLGSALSDVHIEGNTLTETLSPARASYGVYFDNGAANSATRCTYRNNPTINAAGLGIFDLVQQAGLKRDLTGEAAWNPSSVASGASTSTTVTVTGAVVGDEAIPRFTQALPAGVALAASITAADTATVTLVNLSGAAVDLAGGTARVAVTQR